MLTRHALQGMMQIPGLTIYGIKDLDSPRFNQRGGVIAFEIQKIIASSIAKKLAEQGGIGIRSGCHCAHLLVKRLLHVPPWAEKIQKVIVILLPKVKLPGIARVSLGIENTPEEIDILVRVLGRIARKS